jgi:hypothetical protein
MWHERRHRGRSPGRRRLDGTSPRAPRPEGARGRPRHVPERHALHPPGPGARRRAAAALGDPRRRARRGHARGGGGAIRSRPRRPARALPGVRGRQRGLQPAPHDPRQAARRRRARGRRRGPRALRGRRARLRRRPRDRSSRSRGRRPRRDRDRAARRRRRRAALRGRQGCGGARVSRQAGALDRVLHVLVGRRAGRWRDLQPHLPRADGRRLADERQARDDLRRGACERVRAGERADRVFGTADTQNHFHNRSPRSTSTAAAARRRGSCRITPRGPPLPPRASRSPPSPSPSRPA